MIKKIENIRDKMDRKLTGRITGINEFTYDNGNWVRADLPYSIYYTKDKIEYYITDTIVPEIITLKKGSTDFAKYKKSKNGSIASTQFVTPYAVEVKKKDIKNGYLDRYFVQRLNDNHSPLIEINKSQFGNPLPYYTKGQIRWVISGKLNDVVESNIKALDLLRDIFPETFISISFTEYWQDVPTKKEAIEKKLGF